MTLTLTRVTGTIVLPSGEVPRNGRVVFALRGWDRTDSHVVLGEVEADLDDNGALPVLDLQSSAAMDAETIYVPTVTWYSERQARLVSQVLSPIAVPSTGPVDIADLLAAPVTEPVAPDVLALALAAQAGAEAAAVLTAADVVSSDTNADRAEAAAADVQTWAPLRKSTLALVLAMGASDIAVGDVVECRDTRSAYARAADAATDHDLTGTNGLKFYVQPGVLGYDVRAWGAVENLTDSTSRAANQTAFEAARDKAGDGGSVVAVGTFAMQKKLTELNQHRQRWFVQGLRLGGGIRNAGVEIYFVGEAVLDYTLAPAQSVFAISYFRGEGVRHIRTDGAWPQQVLMGGCRGGQVVNVDDVVSGEHQASRFSACAKSDSLICDVPEHLTATAGTITTAGASYPDGKWFAWMTSSAAGVHTAFYLETSGGAVTFAAPIIGGKGHVSGDVLSFSLANTHKLGAAKTDSGVGGNMGAGSGFTWTVGTVLTGGSGAPGAWANSNRIRLMGRDCQAAGDWFFDLNYHLFDRCYTEANWTWGKPYVAGQGMGINFFNPIILTNGATASPSNGGPLTPIVDLGATYGTSSACSMSLGGRNGDQYATTTSEFVVDDLFKLGDDGRLINIGAFSDNDQDRGWDFFSHGRFRNIRATGDTYFSDRLNPVPVDLINATASGSTTGHTIAIDLSTPLATLENRVFMEVTADGVRAATGTTATKQVFAAKFTIIAVTGEDGTQSVLGAITGAGATLTSVAIAASVVTITFATTNTMTTPSQWDMTAQARDKLRSRVDLW